MDTRPLYKRGKWMGQLMVLIVVVAIVLIVTLTKTVLPDLAWTALLGAVPTAAGFFQHAQGKVDEAKAKNGHSVTRHDTGDLPEIRNA